ncbi:retrotransposon hot spot (RHS) protein [Trypanosoma cruzi]|nr:retrotransposon hot spot (RHS) protein [Trypanosoma cruzi]
MGSVTAVAVVECSPIGAFVDPTWSAEQRGATHAQEAGVSASTALAIRSWDVTCFFGIFIFGDMRGSGVLAFAGCSWLPVLSFLLFSRSTHLRVTDQTFLRACGGVAFLFGKKAIRRHNDTAVRATRGSREFPGIYWRGGTAPMRCGRFVFRNARWGGCALTTSSSEATRAARGAKRRSGGCVLPSDT